MLVDALVDGGNKAFSYDSGEKSKLVVEPGDDAPTKGQVNPHAISSKFSWTIHRSPSQVPTVPVPGKVDGEKIFAKMIDDMEKEEAEETKMLARAGKTVTECFWHRATVFF